MHPAAHRFLHRFDTRSARGVAPATAIDKAEHFIYIENQFFVTTAADPEDDARAALLPPTLVRNRIGHALYRRVKRAHDAGQSFRIIVIIPLLPAFNGRWMDVQAWGTGRATASDLWRTCWPTRTLVVAGMPDDPAAGALRIVLERQLDSIARGPDSLMGRLHAEGPS